MFDGKPEDRASYAIYILDIEIDHKEVKGELRPYERISFGKRGDPGFINIVDSRRLEKEDPALFEHVLPILEHWRKTQAISTVGHPVEAWPLLTKAQIKVLKNLGLGSVEDVAAATDSIREKYGTGFADLKKQAKAFLESKADAALAKKYEDQQSHVAQLAKDLEEARAMIDELMAEKGRKPQRPNLKKVEEAA